MPPPFVRYDTTGLLGLSRSIAYTAFGAPLQFPLVAAYIIVPTATALDDCALAGRNGAGRCMSLPVCRPTTCSMPSAETT
jgi:hypothetical protein